MQHSQALLDDSQAPILHYRCTIADVWGSLAYIERAIDEGERYQSVVDRHLGRLYGMALVTMIETLERFLKETAAECVDCLAPYVIDDRFNAFKIQGSTLCRRVSSSDSGQKDTPV